MLPVGTTLEQKRLPRVTLTLVVANFTVFFMQPLLLHLLGWERAVHLTYGTKSLSVIGLFTSIFLHADIPHVFFNNLFLWVFGPPVEERVGPKPFLLYYIGAGVAANFLSLFVNVLFHPDWKYYGLGASGAISGVMALYLYRCWHAKVKMLVPIFALPFTFKVPAVPIMILWFVKEVFRGVGSLAQESGINHWAHVGGFLCGLVIGRVKRYGREAAVEHYSGKVLDEVRAGMGWKGMKDESSLLKLLDLAPEDPEVRLQLAQYYASKGETQKAREQYRETIQKFFVRNPLFAAFALLERLDADCGTMDLHYHLRAAEALTSGGFTEEAYRVLKPALAGAPEGQFGEKSLLLFIRICRELWKVNEAQEAFDRFTSLFPASPRCAEALKALAMKPGEIFPKKNIVLPEEATRIVQEEENEAKTDVRLARRMNDCLAILSDPLFFFVWVAFLPLLAITGNISVYALLITPLAYLATGLYRTNWTLVFREATADEKKARAESEASTLLNRALLADRGEDYEKAAGLYEKYLAGDPAHIQARFNLARIYHKRLNDRNNALRQYRKLLEVLPPDHPYRHESEAAVKAGCRVEGPGREG